MAEVVLLYIGKGYGKDELQYGDDLYSASYTDVQTCLALYDECIEIGVKAFRKKYIGK